MKETYRFNKDELGIVFNKLLRLHPDTKLSWSLSLDGEEITLDYEEPKFVHASLPNILSLLSEARMYVEIFRQSMHDDGPTDFAIEASKAKIVLDRIDAVLSRYSPWNRSWDKR